MKIVWSPFAQERVAGISEYIARDNLSAAEKWVDSIFNAVKRLTDFPESGRIVPEIEKKEIREIIIGNYRIIYRLSKREIRILTVRHGRQILSIEEVGNE